MEASRELRQMCGTVVAVNALDLQLTIKRLLLPLDFKVAATAQITTATRPIATLSDLQVGDWVEVFYKLRGKHRVAVQIVQAAP